MNKLVFYRDGEPLIAQPVENNPIVIYHANCADGFSAAWCFYNTVSFNNPNNPNDVVFDFHPGVYNDPPPDCSGREVYLVDFSYKRAVVEEILKVAKRVVLIDHHKTALEDLKPLYDTNCIDAFNPFLTAYVDLERSGAMLAWDYIHNTRWGYDKSGAWLENDYKPGDTEYAAPPLLLCHVQDRDLWRFKLPGTREIQAAVFSYDYTFENWDRLMKFSEADLLALEDQGVAIERKHHKDIKELVNVCRRLADIGGYIVPIASLPYVYSSDAGHLMAAEYKEGSVFAACYWDTAEHRIFSLRSCDNGLDVSAIAKQYGGGGHNHAAGFRVERSHALAIL